MNRRHCLKLVDASTLPESIGRDAGDEGQSTRCSMTIVTHNDFDWVHEMASVSFAIFLYICIFFFKSKKDNYIKHVKEKERKKRKKMRCRTSCTKV